VVVYGDVLADLDLQGLVQVYLAQGGPTTLALYHVENPSACGPVELAEGSRITRAVEKPPPEEAFSDLASASGLVLEPAILGHIPAHVPYDFGLDLFPCLLQRGVPLVGVPLANAEYLIDIGTLAKHEQAQRDWPALHSRP
jgi:mannose-1-phosphate guanylyltransferase